MAARRNTRTFEWAQTRDLLRELIARDIKLRYRGSLLGILWTLLNPLAELLVLYFVFGTVLQVTIPNFPAYLFTGLLVYGWFQTSLNFATGAVVANRELVRRPGVPVLILPVVTVASNLVHFVLSLPILIGLLLVTHVPLTAVALLLPGLIAIEFVLILGFAYPVATVNVWFRDTSHVLRIALQLLFYMTPIFYETSTVPANLQWWYRVNPLTHLVGAYRAILMRGELPDAGGLTYLTLFSIAVCLAGMAWYRRASYKFADEI
ncbi:MAG TPA: ABC transporter permease [Vicinamibacterales bacterium]|nr:ABC transporter permease [Vicinamibacterales bacterium]